MLPKKRLVRFHRVIRTIALLSLLACGGGGGSGSSDPAKGMWSSPHPVPAEVPGFRASGAGLRAATPSDPGPLFGSIASGEAHGCGISPEGTVKCWGESAAGQLGTGLLCVGAGVGVGLTAVDPPGTCTPTYYSDAAVEVPGLAAVTAIASGSAHTCAVAAGITSCWGQNWFYQLGAGTQDGMNAFNVPGGLARATPTPVLGLDGTTLTQLAAGSAFTCGLTTAGSVKCWGGWLALSSGADHHMDPIAVDVTVGDAPLSGVATVAAGVLNACAASSDHGLWCWGANDGGQIGNGTVEPTDEMHPGGRNVPPTRVAALEDVKVTRVAVGRWHTCALTGAGKVRCWGANDKGQLGDGTTQRRLSPVEPLGLRDLTVTDISAGWANTCAAISGGGVMCWGSNEWGESGRDIVPGSIIDGEPVNTAWDGHPYPTPASIPALEGVPIAGLSAYGYFECARTADGNALCWGAGMPPR